MSYSCSSSTDEMVKTKNEWVQNLDCTFIANFQMYGFVIQARLLLKLTDEAMRS